MFSEMKYKLSEIAYLEKAQVYEKSRLTGLPFVVYSKR